MNRDRNYYRRRRHLAIRRKTNILLSYGGFASVSAWSHGGQTGRLSKGKIHCSCPLCRLKSYDKPSHRDAKLQVDARDQMK